MRARVLLGICVVSCTKAAPEPVSPPLEDGREPTLAQASTASANDSDTPEPTPASPKPPTDICAQINETGELPRPPNPSITGPTSGPLTLGAPSTTRAADVWRRVLEASEPPWSKLERTTWARRDGRPGCTRVRFCVADDGSVESIATILPFRGDPRVDAIVIATVSSWKFRPLDEADGEPACIDSDIRIQVPE